MDILFIVAGSAFIIWALRNCIYWVHLWQIKEYRLDRMIIHLRETVQGRNLFFSPLSLFKWAAFGLYAFVIFQEEYTQYFHLTVTVLFVVQAVSVLKELLLSQFRRPEMTPKAISLILTSFVVTIVIFSFPLMDKFFWLLLIDRMVPLAIAFFVFIHSFPTELYRDWEIRKAMKKIKSHKNLLVIAITGSYGKSSTKEYIARILDKKFSVIKTRGDQHTLSGIAQVINKELTPETQVLVAEMGTYGKDEIAHMCYVTQPTVGVITGINYQHLSLFDSFKDSVSAKYELIGALPKNGIALFNGNDIYVKKLYTKTKKKKVLFGYGTESGKNQEKFDIYADSIVVGKSDVGFTVHLNKQRFRLKAPLLGSHAIEHLLPAIYIALSCNMPISEIRKVIATLKPLPNTMTVKKTHDGILILDDTFNSNPESLAAAIDYVHIYKKNKYLVFQPMIELGKDARDEHYRVGQKIAHICTAVFLTNKNYQKDIQKGIQDAKGTCTVTVGAPRHILKKLQKIVQKGDVIVCEGKEARRVVEQFVR